MTYGPALADLYSYYIAANQLIAPTGAHLDREFSVQVATGLNRETFDRLKQAACEDGHTSVLIMYDARGAKPKLDSVWIFKRATDAERSAQGHDLTVLIDCELWAPEASGPIVVVAPEDYGGCFTVSADGARLEHRPDKPAQPLAQGTRRAHQRLRRLARSGRLHPVADATLYISKAA